MSRRLVSVVAVLALVVAGALLLVARGDGSGGRRTLVATFARTTSLYEGADVKVLGVDVGRVDHIEVEGTAVQVTIRYDRQVKLPADVRAVIVPPSIVGDRFVQLAPAWEDGPVLADGARLGLDRTGVPLELDDNYRALDEIAEGLGPKGANRDGALSRLVRATARQLGGRGKAFNETVRELSSAVATLASGSDDINGSVRNIGRITRTLKGKDQQIRRLVVNLALVATELNGQRDGITRAVRGLRSALRDVDGLTRRHGEALTRTIHDLTAVAGILERHTDTIASAVRLAPVGLVSMGNIYVPKNWDPSRPWLTPVAGRAGSLALHAPLLEDMGVQLGFALGSVCTHLPPEQAARLAVFCSGLAGVGNQLGQLLTQVGNGVTSGGASLGGGAR
ncbi:MAG TPA: MCE family protein [Nocardioides sp.]|nr:MCE family protein [Nocardioides sp.]